MKVLGIILAGGGSAILPLTIKRASAAVPMFGKYRAIDFTLSNMVNSGITKVGIVTQYNPRSLMDHLGSGKDWDLDRKRGGLFILQPYLSVGSGKIGYKGTADALFQNMTLFRRGDEDYVLIGSGDHIYNMDFTDLFKQHIMAGVDVTLVVKELDETYDLTQYGIVEVDAKDNVIGFEEKPSNPKTNLAFLGIYFMSKYLLMDLLYATVPHGGYNLLLDVLLPNMHKFRFKVYRFKGYWRNIKKSINEYYRTNMDGLRKEVRDELFHAPSRIYTKSKDLPPPKITATGHVENSIVADGCIVSGTVRNSILFRDVHIKAGAVVENSLILEGTRVGEGSYVSYAIVDKDSVIRPGKIIRGNRDRVLAFEKASVL